MRNTSLIAFTSIILLSLFQGCASTDEGTDNKPKKSVAKDKLTRPTDENGRNIIRSIEFVNNKAFNDKALLKRVDFEVGDYLDPILADAYRRTLAEFYRKKGFPFAEVTLDNGQLENGRVVYTFNEGQKVRVASVNFSGNKSMKTSALENAIKTKTKRWFFWPAYYLEEVPAEDVARLQTIYHERGFLDFHIEDKKQFTNGKVNITFEIDEGPSYTVGDISFTGGGYFEKDKLMEGLQLKPGQVYHKRRAEDHVKQLLKLYHENGFVDAAVEQKYLFTRDPRVVNLVYNIREGNQFRVGRVDITGNEQTQDKVIRRVLDEYGFTPGEFYNADLAPREGNGKLEKYVQQMTLSDEVIIRPVAPVNGADNAKDIKVDIKEGQTGSLMFAGGVSSDSDIIGQLILEQRNFDITDWPESFGEFITGNAFKGAGQTFSIRLEPGTVVSQYSVSFSEPYFQDKPVSLNISGTSYDREIERRGDHKLYDEGRTRGYVGFEKRHENKWRSSIGFKVENVEVDSIYLYAPKEIKDAKGYTFLPGIKFGIGRDLRDDIFNPSSGYKFDVSYEQVTGDEAFGVLEGSIVGFKTLYEDLADRKTVLAAKLLAATTFSYAPPFERFYAGGTSIYGIRGFDYRGISTRGLQTNVANPQRKDPIGSEWILLANTEVAVPVISDNLSALFFIDSGAIDTGNYRASVGTGLQVLIPQWSGPMPMRFEFAVPVSKDDKDETRVFSFSMRGLF
ncbi:MAG: outer membrane protein assembly factor BamA [Sedimentisphaerales bacterium]|nr:outer membrane protein assembly factor BamA [Sedimentisphaerales bacterium]